MSRRPLISAALAVVAACTLTPAAHAAGTLGATETLALDFHEAPSDGAAGPVSTAAALAAGEPYVVTVQGTVSAYSASLWGAATRLCGTPEPAPMTASPFVANAAVGTDAEVHFARPLRAGGCAAFPRHHDLFRFDLGSGAVHREPTGGRAEAPVAGHRHTYVLLGEGAPLSALQLDSNTVDNYGVYTITVSGREGCRDGGWRTLLDGAFRNQGDCVSWFTTDRRNEPARSVATARGAAPASAGGDD